MKKTKLAVAILIIFLCFPAYAFAETILLKSGKTVEGKLIEKTDKYIKIDFAGVPLTYFFDEITSVNDQQIPSSITRKTEELKPYFSSETGLFKLSKIISEFGCNPSEANEMAIRLAPLYNKIHFRDKNNLDFLSEDISANMDVVTNDIFDKNGIVNSEHIKLISLLINKDQRELFQKYFENLSSQQKKALAPVFCRCGYIAWLTYIILEANDFDATGILVDELRDEDQKLDFAKTTGIVENHVSCAVKIQDQYIYSDFALKFVSKPFHINEVYYNHLNNKQYWKLRENIGRSDLFKEIRLIDKADFKPILYHNLGLFFLLTNQYDFAMSFYQKSISLNPSFPNVYTNLGNMFISAGKYQEAMAYFQKAIALKPNCDFAYTNMGICYSSLGEYDKAIMHYEKALELNKNSYDNYYNLGNVFFQRKEYPQAISNYLKTIELQPNHVQACYNLGVAYDLSHDYQKAITYYERASDLNPQCALCYNNLGIVYYNLERTEKAKTCFRRAMELFQEQGDFQSSEALKKILAGLDSLR